MAKKAAKVAGKKKRSSISPTKRTLAWLSERGVMATITERWNPFARVRQDLFGFADLVALWTDNWPSGIMAIQVTSGSNVSARIDKIRESPAARAWLVAGGSIEVHGWRQLATYRKDGTRAARDRWELRRIAVWIDSGAIAWSEIDENGIKAA
jgi:hypothetical protein